MNKRGIVMIAMGEEYERLASETLQHSIRNVEIPVTVIFNRENYTGDWSGLELINKVFVNCETNKNREIKTQLYEYTPYEETLYMDVDAVIHKKGIEKVFDKLKTAHIVFQRHFEWVKYKKYYDIYRRAMNMFDCQLPIDVMIGGFFAFRKTSDVKTFFDLWLEYWEDFGSGRDMPPLACAVQNSGINYNTITRQDDKFFSFGMDYECVAIHRVHGDDLKYFGIKPHKQNKPFDVGCREDWNMVYFNFHQNKWLEKKVNVELQNKREHKYIQKYMPFLREGGKQILDIGCGFGQFCLICRRYGNTAIGIMPPLEKYETKQGINNSDSFDYELYSRDRMKKNRIPFIECDFSEAVKKNNFPVFEKRFDVINCKHAINLILREHFDFKKEMNIYDNLGEWILSESLKKEIVSIFVYVDSILNDNGMFILASLNSTNAKDYSDFIQEAAMSVGFDCQVFNENRTHVFKRVTSV
jgi:SAM-dependent methyltransferase